MFNFWDKKKSLFIPMLIIIAVVPLIVFLKRNILSEMALQAWPARAVNLDFFSYYKANWIVIFGTIGWFYFIFRHKMKEEEFKPYYIPIFAYMGMIIISTYFSKYREITLTGLPDRYESVFVLVVYLLITIIMMNIVEKEDEIKLVMTGLFASAFIVALIGILQYFGADFFKSSFGSSLIVPDAIEKEIGRLSFRFGDYTIYSTLYNTNYVGSYMVMLLMILFPIYLTAENWKSRVASGAFLLLIFSNWVGCRSRAGIIGGTIALVFMLLFMRKKILPNFKWFFGIILSAALIFCIMDYASGYTLSGKYLTLKKEIAKVADKKIKNMRVEGKSFIVEKYGTNSTLVITVNKEKGEINITNEKGTPLKYEIKDGLINIKEKDFDKHVIEVIDDKKIVVKNERGKITLNITEKGINYINNRGGIEELNGIESIDRIKFLDGKEEKGTGRAYIWSRTIPLLKNSLIIGSGPDTFSLKFPQNDRAGKFITWGDPNIVVDKPHNMYLQIAVNTGVVSLIAFLLLIGYYVFESMRIYIKSDFSTYKSRVGLGVMLAVIGYCGAALFNDSLVSVAPVFWALLGTGIGINRMNSSVSLLKNS